MENANIEQLVETWRREWPAAIAMTEVERLTGGILRRRTTANLKSLGVIPPEVFIRLGRRVVVLRDPLLAWLAGHLEADGRGKRPGRRAGKQRS